MRPLKLLKHFALILGLTALRAGAQTNMMSGIGTELGVEGQYVVIKHVLKDGPAASHKEVHAGDRIIAVGTSDEPPVQIKQIVQAVGLIRGPKGTTVRLTLVSPGEDESQARVVSIVRGEIKDLSRWGDGVLLTNGVSAPDIEMVTLPEGASERLSKYAGKIVVLKFWATWCGPCQPAMADYQNYLADHPDWKDQVILISASVDDSKAKAAGHLKEKGWNKSHNVWVADDAPRAYHMNAIPTTYVISREGRVVAANPRDLAGLVDQELKRKVKNP